MLGTARLRDTKLLIIDKVIIPSIEFTTENVCRSITLMVQSSEAATALRPPLSKAITEGRKIVDVRIQKNVVNETANAVKEVTAESR